MTVRHLRIDNRLIHGQVTVAWAGNLGAQPADRQQRRGRGR